MVEIVRRENQIHIMQAIGFEVGCSKLLRTIRMKTMENPRQ